MELMKAFRTLLFIALISTVSIAQVPQAIIETPAWPQNPPDSWLTYHLAHPGPGEAFPGDPNCAFYWKYDFSCPLLISSCCKSMPMWKVRRSWQGMYMHIDSGA